MAKKCLICDDEATYCIKGTFDFYCEPCAIEQFGDVAVLVRVEEEAKRLKDMIDKSIQSDNEHQEDQDLNQ